MSYEFTKMQIITMIERMYWETNQFLSHEYNIPIEDIRRLRSELKIHNRHDVDDEELEREEWE